MVEGGELAILADQFPFTTMRKQTVWIGVRRRGDSVMIVNVRRSDPLPFPYDAPLPESLQLQAHLSLRELHQCFAAEGWYLVRDRPTERVYERDAE